MIRFRSLAVVAIALCATNARCIAEPITVYFSATIPFLPHSPLQAGEKLLGRYTFESSTPDSVPGNNTLGRYVGAVTDFRLVVPYISQTATGFGTIQIFNNSLINNVGPYLDNYVVQVSTTPMVFRNEFDAEFELFSVFVRLSEENAATPPTVLTSDSLLAGPPAFKNFGEHDLILLLRGEDGGQAGHHSPLTYLSTDPIPIPEPTVLALVDIKPGSVPNPVNLKSKGVLPVAILGTDEFDVTDVDFDSLMFGDPLLIDNGGTAVSPLRSSLVDISGDGFLDLTLKFSTTDLVEYEALGPDTIEGLLTGALLDGTPFEGMDSIRIVPLNGSNGNSLQVSTVPEPTTCTLALAALCLATSRRRSR